MIIQMRSVSENLENHRLIIRMHTDGVLHGRQNATDCESRDGGKAVGGSFVKVTHFSGAVCGGKMNEALNPPGCLFDYP